MTSTTQYVSVNELTLNPTSVFKSLVTWPKFIVTQKDTPKVVLSLQDFKQLQQQAKMQQLRQEVQKAKENGTYQQEKI
jgi:hypothetical protein